MKKQQKHSIVAILARHLGLCASLACAQTTSVYVIDGRGSCNRPVRPLLENWLLDPGRCGGLTRTVCKCDKDLIPKEVCEPRLLLRLPRLLLRSRLVRNATVAADALFDFNKSTRCVRKASRSWTKSPPRLTSWSWKSLSLLVTPTVSVVPPTTRNSRKSAPLGQGLSGQQGHPG